MGNAGHAGASSDILAEMMRGAYRPQSNPSASRLAAGEAGFLHLSQSLCAVVWRLSFAAGLAEMKKRPGDGAGRRGP